MEPPPPMLDRSDEAIVRAIVEHDAFLVATLVRLSGVELHEDADATWYLSGVADALFNGVIRTSISASNADRRIRELLTRFRDAGVPALWWAGPLSLPDDLSMRLAAKGLARTTLPGMALDLHEMATPPPPGGLRVEVVADDRGIDAWMAASGEGFGIDPAMLDRFRRTPEAVLAGDVPGWCVTGWVDDRPVATGMVCIGTGVAGVSNVTTIASHRRRGLGAAVTRHALALARDRGYRTAVLTSTREGRQLYDAMGFVTRCEVDLFELPADRAGT
jgi:GNAT superfamily N-acetyltransferase